MTYKEEYEHYLQSDEWALKRQETFELYGKACKKCGNTKTIHVHHKTYARLKREIVETDLVPLCRKCHKKVHKFCKHNKLDLYVGTNEFLKSAPNPRKLRKRLAKQRKFKKATDNYKIPPRSVYIPLERYERASIPRKPKIAGAIDIQKFMAQYSLSEDDARQFIKTL